MRRLKPEQIRDLETLMREHVAARGGTWRLGEMIVPEGAGMKDLAERVLGIGSDSQQRAVAKQLRERDYVLTFNGIKVTTASSGTNDLFCNYIPSISAKRSTAGRSEPHAGSAPRGRPRKITSGGSSGSDY